MNNKVKIDQRAYNQVAKKLRRFFDDKGFIECETQSNLSIIRSCEDPFTVRKFQFDGFDWPLPQSGQMVLEEILLQNPDYPGVYTFTTSYRDEPNPIPGRHVKTFCMFEFEAKGNVDDLKALEKELLVYLGFSTFDEKPYENVCKEVNKNVLDDIDEEWLCQKNKVVFLTEFPDRTSPFWNMKSSGNGLNDKVDVIIHGQETFGSAERSCDSKEMLDSFHSIMDGKYAAKLYELFGRERVDAELKEYLSHDFFPRFGCGIGISRLIRGMRLEGLFND